MTNLFWKTLFDEGEHTCYSPAHAKGTKIYPVGQGPVSDNIFSINPIDSKIDHNPTEAYHSATKPRRADHNVIVYRNFLIECDKLSIEEQVKLIRTTKKLPYATAIYSGGKSIHFIISLSTPVKTRKEYDALAKRILKAMGGKELVDVTCKNSSRLSRCPNVFRDDKEKVQILIEVKNRVALQELEEWLNKNNAPQEIDLSKTIRSKSKLFIATNGGHLNGFTLNFLMSGAPDGEWNINLFKAVCDLTRNGMSEAQIEDALLKITGILDSKDWSTIKSAISQSSADL